jgi:hypothetical protein
MIAHRSPTRAAAPPMSALAAATVAALTPATFLE